MSYAALQSLAHKRYLTILGGLHPDPETLSDLLPANTQTLLMLGPHEPAFWPQFTAQPEYTDGHPDPLDRWSKRIVDALAVELAATAFYPSDGPPFPPFFSWAMQTGHCFQSPIQLLVHDSAGMFVSFRGVLALPQHIDLPSPQQSPCLTCVDTPCVTTCPVNAFATGTYDVPTCKAYITADPTQACMTSGCIARRSCPVSQTHPRIAAQSAFHMKAFLAP
jgi:hypothetical protein